MSDLTKGPSVQFGLTLTQKLLYLLVPLVLSVMVIFGGPLLTGTVGTILFILLGIVLGLVTFFISAGWGYSLEVGDKELKITDKRVNIVVPMEKIGLVSRNSGFPFPTLWVILKNAPGVGNEIPAKGVDPATRQLIEAYMQRNPSKQLTYVPVPGGYVRSVGALVSELKRRIPPLTVDERLAQK